MKKSTKRVVGVGLTGISVLSPLMDTGITVLAMSESESGVQQNDTFDWVKGEHHSSNMKLVNNNTDEKFWFYDDVTKTIYAKGGTYAEFRVNKEGLESKVKSIEIMNGEESLGKATDKTSFKILIRKIPSGSNTEVVYTFEDGSVDKIPFYSYFTGIKGGVTGHVVDNTNPKFDLDNKDTGVGIVFKDYFKGKLNYTFQSDKINKLLPNIWGTTGYKFRLSINEKDYSDSGAFTVKHNDTTGKVDISIDFNKLSSSLDGKCDVKIQVLDNLGNETVYSDTVNLDYSAPSIKGNITGTKWVDSENNIVYFSEGEDVKFNYDVSDTGSGIKNVSLIKDGVVTNPKAKEVGSIPIKEDGVYEIKVEDNIGNSKTYKLSEIVDGVSDNVKFDKSKPSVNVQASGIVKDDWFKNDSSLKVDIKDDIALKSVSYTVNGSKKEVKLDGNPKETSFSITPDMLKDTDVKLNINIEVTDMLGKVSNESISYNSDLSYPTLSNAKVTGDITVIEGKAWSKKPLKLSGTPKDVGSGIESVGVYKDGVLVSDTLPFTISEDGVYSVKLTDKVGNVTEYSLSEIVKRDFTGVVIDGNPPSAEASVNGVEVSSDWYKDNGVLVIKSKDDKNIKSVKYSINGKETVVDVNKTDFTLELKLEDYVDEKGLVDIDYEVTDVLGNIGKYSKVIKLDKVKPSIENANLEGNIFMLGNIAFLKGEAVLSSDILDKESGIKSIEVLKGGKVVADSLPYTIDKGGIYSVRVTDNVGHVVTKSLSDLLSKDIGDIVIDNDAPVLKTTINGDVPVDDWYKDKAKLVFNSSDSSAIKSVEYSLNGKKFSEEVNDKNNEVSVDLEKYVSDSGKVDVKYKVEDGLGSETTFNKVISIDTKDPVIEKGKLSGKVLVQGNVGYASEKLTLDANIYDNESGVSKVEVFKDGEVVSKSLPYVISESGTYSVRVTDGVGHVVNKTLRELTGVEVNSIVMDSAAPVITEVEGFNPDLEKDGVNWYKKIPSLKVNISDDNLDSISIKVNDKEVIKDISSDGNYSIPLENKEGSFKVDISSLDKAGNTANSGYSFKVDLNKPVLEKGILKGDYVDRGYGLYFNSMPKVTFKGSDSAIGVKEYVLLNSAKQEISRNETGVFTLGTGEYFAKTVDYFGRESKVISLKKLCGLSSNRIVIDNESPVILASRPEGDLNGWFNKNVIYDVSLSDNVGINNAKIYINDKLVDSFEAKSDATNIAFMVDTAKVYDKDGEYTVRVVVEDNTGLSSEWSDTINIDTTAPRFVKGTVLDKYVDRGDCIVFPSKPSIKVETRDDGIGLKEIYLQDKDGKVVTNKEGYFDLDANEYTLVLEDKLGNKTEATTIKDVCGLPHNKIEIDTSKPVVDVDRANGIYKDWFSDDVKYSMNLKDNMGLKKIVVSINGKKVINDTLKANDTTALDYNFSTKGINPNKDGSYNVSVNVVDIVGNSSKWTDTVYVDKDAPVIDKFIITGKGYLEGKDNNSSDKYGFYIKGKTDIEVHVSDGSYSSGVDTLNYELVSSDGKIDTGVAKVSNGVAKISIGRDFKGYIRAHAVDRVGNVGKTNRPDGIISESSNMHVNTSKIDLDLPETAYRDSKGNYLYNNDIVIDGSIVDSYSGIRKVKWGINSDTKGVLEVDNSGNITGDTANVKKRDKNLVIKLDKDLGISNNANSLNIWVEVEDRVGHISKSNRVVSIDKDAPIINVSYNDTNGNSFYNKTRVATVTIMERNFRSGDVKFEGVLGNVDKWTNIGDDTWSCNIEFSEDKDYQWSVGYTDMAGNTGKKYSSEKFTVDKTAPVINVSFDNNSSANGNYYKNSRTATITVKERNFDSSLVKLAGNGKLGSWNKNGDVYTTNIVFDKDGKYEFGVSMSDKAGNGSNSFSSGSFIIDKTLPTLNIEGVQNGVSYKKNASFKVLFGDENIDESKCSVTLTGRSNGKVRLIGGINGKNGEFTFSGVPKDTKFDDLYTLKSVIYDKAGNRQDKELTFSINRYGSKFAFKDKNILNNIVNSSKNIVLEEISVDRLNIKDCKVVVIKDGKEIKIDNKYIKIEEFGGKDSNWLYRYTIDREAFNSDGKYQVQVFSKAYDGTKNSSLSQEYAFVLDTTSPDVIISGVESGKSYNDVNKKVSIEIRDLSGVGSIKAILNGEEAKLSEKDGIYYLTVNESTKKQDLSVEVTDKAGNVSVVEISDFLVTSNFIVSFVNSPIIKGLLATISGGILLLLLLLFKRRKDRQKEEKELAQEHAKMYHDSITGTSTNSSSDSTKDK